MGAEGTEKSTPQSDAVGDGAGTAGAVQPLGCLVVESFTPVRARLIDELVKNGLRVVGAVNHVDAIHQMARHGVPHSFVISASAGEGKGLALVRGLGKVAKTKGRLVVLVVDDARLLERLQASGLPDSVVPLLRYQPIATVVGTLLKRLPPGVASAGAGVDIAAAADGAKADAAGTALIPELSAASGVTKDQIYSLERAFDTFDQVLTMVRQNRLPGPMMPDILDKVRTVFAKPDVDFPSVTGFVAQHQTLAARLLAVANSAFYARGGRVTSLEIALSRLGLREASTQLQTIAARAFLVGSEPGLRKGILRQLEAAYIVAVVAQHLGKRANIPRDDLYTIGLFHNIGPTFLLYTVALLWEKKAVKEINQDGLESMIANRAADLNALVAERLTLPGEIVTIHRVKDKDADPLIAVMHQAMWVADRLLRTRDAQALQADMEAQLLGLTEETIESLKVIAPSWLELLEVYDRA